MVVCEYCNAAIYWDTEKILNAGKQAALAEGFTRLYRGAIGRIDKRQFQVLGRVRYSFGRGFWDEWYVELGDGTGGWITEDNHELCLEHQVEAAVDSFGSFRRLTIEGSEFVVEESGKAECLGVEGDLPLVITVGESYQFVDGSSPDGRLAMGIEYDQDPPSVFVGRWLAHSEVRLEDEGEEWWSEGEKARQAPLQGRPRPPYRPRAIECSNCRATISLKTERPELRVCEYCGAQLDLTAAEAKILGKSDQQGWSWNFPFSVGDPFTFDGARYEIVSRMAFVEDGDPNERTRQYLLYSPCRGTLYLDEYNGSYSLSRTSHLMPIGDPFAASRGDTIVTHDGRRWVNAGVGEYELRYVDGALPWLARTGDRSRYAEFEAHDGSSLQYEVEAQGREIEFGLGRSLDLEEVRQAAGRPSLSGAAAAELGVATTRRWYFRLIALALASFLLNGGLWLWARSAGKTVLKQDLTPSLLDDEVLTEPFVVAKDNSLVKVTVEASRLDNAWASVDLALVEGEDSVLHVFEGDVEYYHGVEGGESWSEGSKDSSAYILVPRRGQHRLLVHAINGQGEQPQKNAFLPLRLTIVDGAAVHWYFAGAALLSLGMAVVLALAYSAWKKANDDDSDDDDDDDD
ncbi:MAG: DUF4178 domain-containing protein [Pseudomonadota bacterium]